MKMNKEVVLVRISDIIPNRFQPRLTFDEEALNELSESIKEHGIIQPLILRDLGDKYEIIAGERRYKAASQAGLEVVPAIIGAMDDQTSAELALVENIQREGLSAIEEAKSYKNILDMGGFTQDELAKRMGKSQSAIANKLRLLSLTSEVQDALMKGLISERHARSLLQVKDEEKQVQVLNKIINEKMNVKVTDEYIKNMNYEPVREEIPTSNVGASPMETPVVEKSPIPSVETSNYKEPGNPNVYAQDKQDFVNMDKLTEEENRIVNDTFNYSSNTESSVPTEVEKQPEEKLPIPQVENMDEDDSFEVSQEEVFKQSQVETSELVKETNVEKNAEVKEDKMSKVKLATAIRLAKDTVEDIRTAGYSVTLEEIDEPGNYKLVINVEK